MVLLCGYTSHTWFILLGMIISGAARSIVVKLSYQSGFEAPLTVTLLYLLGQSFSLFLYGFQKYFAASNNNGNNKNGNNGSAFQNEWLHSGTATSVELGSSVYIRHDHDNDAPPPTITNEQEQDQEQQRQNNNISSTILPQASSTLSSSYNKNIMHNHPPPPADDNDNTSFYFGINNNPSYHDASSTTGSTHGLSPQSAQQIQWAHTIPYYAKPAIPALLNMLNSSLRWASLVYIDASVAEMMISGLELTLSVVAARVFRKRMVSKSRWMGVLIVAFGVMIIEHANEHKKQSHIEEDVVENSDNSDEVQRSGSQDVMIGVVLIILQSILSVLQDIGEEIFMQATDFPPTMMLGLEGLYGFCVGLVVYLTLGSHFGIEDVSTTMSMLGNNPKLRWWLVGLPILFLITGYFNIKATGVTSAMTRNVWKNMRTVLVWMLALAIYYLGSGAYGEPWFIPESFVILLGFLVMCAGIIVYYWYKEQEQVKTERSVLGGSINDLMSPRARILT